MNIVQRMEVWGDTHHPKWLDIVRVALGIFLCYKGAQFLNNMGDMLNLMTRKSSFGSFTLVMLSNYIAFAHLLGGVLLVLGMLTRFACLIQIPILIGAIFIINSGDVLRPFSELAISILVLLLLVLFLVVGNGYWSFKWFADRDK
jgi:uncharacterized membrane protein YphA (DoxX/SURF4 family)